MLCIRVSQFASISLLFNTGLSLLTKKTRGYRRHLTWCEPQGLHLF
jgi:hypothetical protein